MNNPTEPDDDEEFFDVETSTELQADIMDESMSFSQNKCFFAVQIKSKNAIVDNGYGEQRIFKNQENAIKVLKKDPENRRFKSFRTFEEAYAFSYETAGTSSTPYIHDVLMGSPVDRLPASPTDKSSSSSQDAEKLPFPAPKKPEVNELRKFIETDNYEAFREKILSNPRYLISAGETPNLCQESFRYNCLHVCAKENRYGICNFLLKTLDDPMYIQKLYTTDSEEQSRARCDHLLDLYLNMPEKGLNETPLHFACKFGSFEVAKLLVGFDACNKTAVNKSGKTPQDLICNKATSQHAKDSAIEIRRLFEDCFYVPLYRDDECGSVIVDKPSPQLSMLLNPAPVFASKYDSNLLSPSYGGLLGQSHHKLAAYVGPVSPTNANLIYDRLKSPARLRQSSTNLDILRGDDYKGYERIVRQLTDELKLPWHEYWGFLNSFSNLKNREGLAKLEVYLEQKKLIGLLDSQKKCAIGIKLEQQSRLSNTFSVVKNNPTYFQKLDVFLELVEAIHRLLDLNDNLLSSKFAAFKSGLTELLIDTVTLKHTLANYMKVILDLCRLENIPTQIYFNLYKTSKIVLDLLNCDNYFKQFSPRNNRLDKNKTQPLSLLNINQVKKIEKPKEALNPFQMRLTKPSLDFSDEEDEENDSPLSDQEEYDTENIFPARKEESMKVEMLTAQMNDSMKIRNADSDNEDTYSLNIVQVKKFVGFKKPANLQGLSTTGSQNAFKLFMFGDAPSKLDRAVYLAIKDINLDLNQFKLLHEWYKYMDSCNKKEMNDWKTPMRRQIQF